MQQLLEILVKNLVKNENDVQISKQEQASSITFVVKVNSEDIGKVIILKIKALHVIVF